MRDLLSQLRSASDAGLYYMALYVALGLPDICGALESTDGVAKGAKYTAWFDMHVAPKYQVRNQASLTGQDAYYFRCSMLHQGRTSHRNSSYSRLLFVEPGASTSTFHNVVLGDALMIDIGVFVRDVAEAVEVWLPSVETSPAYAANFTAFVSRHPSGLPGYFEGLPVIA